MEYSQCTMGYKRFPQNLSLTVFFYIILFLCKLYCLHSLTEIIIIVYISSNLNISHVNFYYIWIRDCITGKCYRNFEVKSNRLDALIAKINFFHCLDYIWLVHFRIRVNLTLLQIEYWICLNESDYTCKYSV